MSKNPFKVEPQGLDPKRNTFDLSFQNNLTLRMGKLTPVMCKEVIPGDTFDIDASFGLRFMPTYFPVQTRMRADLHFFYVRNRNLWNKWQEFISGNPSEDPEVVFPYIGPKPQDSDFFSEGTISDYLGVPTTAVSSMEGSSSNPIRSYFPSSGLYGYDPGMFTARPLNANINSSMSEYYSYFRASSEDPTDASQSLLGFPVKWLYTNKAITVLDSVNLHEGLKLGTDVLFGNFNEFVLGVSNPSMVSARLELYQYVDGAFRMVAKQMKVTPVSYSDTVVVNYDPDIQWQVFNSGYRIVDAGALFEELEPSKCVLGMTVYGDFSSWSDKSSSLKSDGTPINFNNLCIKKTEEGYNYSYSKGVATYQDLHISALPYRAYESIYNGFYRNERVDPMIGDNNKPVYNQYVTNNGSGRDDTPYKLFNRYWEKDFLTTAVPSPQQGTAPLVGLNTNERPFTSKQIMKIGNTDSQITVQTDPTTREVVGISHYSDNLPVGSIEALEEAITYGISINDFRNVNSLQRWLEINERRGFKYRDQIKSHFGVDITFEELDMPEFIGGISQDLNSTTIYNQSAQGAALGDFGGAVTCIGKGDNHIHKRVDEHGFIIAILSISPIPTYSQLLPKHFLKTSHLDYYFPEFGHIGYQPITYKEVTPLQAHEIGVDYLDKVFGYNRAWYDYVASVDEAHGNMRTTMRNFLVNREFSSIPMLSGQFLSIKEGEVNDIFNYQGDTDKIVGQVAFKISAKRPIPFLGTPRLE